MILNTIVAAVGIGIGLLYHTPKSDDSKEIVTAPSA